MEVLNATEVTNIFHHLTKQFTVIGSNNETVNARRSRYFQLQCNRLNEFISIPEDYCSFYWDGITCWNATAPYTAVSSPCVSWPMETTPPEGSTVKRMCLNGVWENFTDRTLQMLYSGCKRMDANAEISESLQALVLRIRYITLVGYCGSALGLLFAMLVFVMLQKLRHGRNWIHFNLFISFFLRFIFCAAEFIHALWRSAPAVECMTFALDHTIWSKLLITSWNYFILASYGWILIEGLYLHNSIYFNVFSESSVTPYVVFGWLSPLCVVIIWAVLKAVYDNTMYWIASCDNRIIWLFRAPLMIVAIAEVIITVNIVRQLYSKVQNEVYTDQRTRYRRFARSFLYLLLSVGGTYFVFDIVLHSTSFFDYEGTLTIVFHCFYTVINSLWGFVIAYLYCFNNREIRKEIRRKLKEHLTSHQFVASTAGENNPCRLHMRSPLLYLSNTGDATCTECALSKKLLELNLQHQSTPDAYADTVCSTIVNSEQNTFHYVPQRVYTRVGYLSFCREEGDESNDAQPDLYTNL